MHRHVATQLRGGASIEADVPLSLSRALREEQFELEVSVSCSFTRDYSTFAIFTTLPFACESFGSFTTVTYSSFSLDLYPRCRRERFTINSVRISLFRINA